MNIHSVGPVGTQQKSLVNGEECECVSGQDRALQYGDGLFETIAVRHGEALLWDAHLRRMQHGCRRLGIPAPSAGLLREDAERLSGGEEQAVLKILVSAGVGGRGYRRLPSASLTRIVSLHAWPSYPQDFYRIGVELRLCETRLGMNPALAGLKHLNRLEQVLARNEWDDPSIAEGLMLDTAGHVVEGTMSNLFLVRSGCLLTPDLSHCGVSGVMRGHILDLARQAGIPTSIEPIFPERLETADEVFLCNSVIGIWPVRKIGRKIYPVGVCTRMLARKLVRLNPRRLPA